MACQPNLSCARSPLFCHTHATCGVAAVMTDVNECARFALFPLFLPLFSPFCARTAQRATQWSCCAPASSTALSVASARFSRSSAASCGLLLPPPPPAGACTRQWTPRASARLCLKCAEPRRQKRQRNARVMQQARCFCCFIILRSFDHATRPPRDKHRRAAARAARARMHAFAARVCTDRCLADWVGWGDGVGWVTGVAWESCSARRAPDRVTWRHHRRGGGDARRERHAERKRNGHEQTRAQHAHFATHLRAVDGGASS
jgi:hypothetical protein